MAMPARQDVINIISAALRCNYAMERVCDVLHDYERVNVNVLIVVMAVFV